MSLKRKRVEKLERQIKRGVLLAFSLVLALSLVIVVLLALLAPGLIGLKKK